MYLLGKLRCGSSERPVNNSCIHRFTHLQHNPFTFIVNVNNKKEAAAKGTVRIFIAPKTDERGQPIPLVEQRRLMAEMDRFTATREIQIAL